ncbi:hypothetical protein ASD21_18165 [Caulobacter sp. Root1455]|nr:hypothetical protein ASD21_18165 [Caulobacter sp. Root1455]
MQPAGRRQMTFPVLDTLKTKIGPSGGLTPVVFDAATLGDPALSASIQCLLQTTPLSIASPTITSDDTYLRITGVTAIGALSNLQVEATFFASWQTGQQANAELELVLRLVNPPASITFDQLGMPKAPPGLVSGGGLTAQQRQAFFQAVTLNGPQLLLSTYDFAAVAAATGAAPPLECSLAATDRPAVSTVAGLNISASLSFAGDFWTAFLATGAGGGAWDDLKAMAGSGDFAVTGALRLDPYSWEPVAELTHIFAPANRPAIRLPFDDLAMDVRALTIRGGLDLSGVTPPGFSLVVGFEKAGSATPEVLVRLDAPLGDGTAMLTGRFATPLGPEWLLSLAGLDNLGSLLPTQLQGVASMGITQIAVSLPLATPANASIAVEISGGTWDLIPSLVSVRPVFGVEVSRDASGHGAATLEIRGDWLLGDAAFELFIDPQAGDLGLVMSPGSSISLDAITKQLGLPAGHDALDILDLELSGNWNTGDYEFLIECGSGWDLDILGATITLTDLQIIGEHESGAMNWRVEGLFGIGDASVDIVVAGGAQPEFDVTFTELAVGDMLEDILLGVDLPETLRDFTLNDVEVHYLPSQSFDIQGSSSTPVALFDGFDFTVASFHLNRTAGAQTASLGLTLDLGDSASPAIVQLAGDYNTDANGQSSWMLVGELTNQDVELVRLIERLMTMAGLDFPLPCDGLAMRNLGCRLAIGGPSDSWAISCDIVDGASTYGRLSFVASRPTAPAAANGAAAPDPAPWTYLLAAELELHLGLDTLPVVGPRLPSPALEIQGVDLLVTSGALSAEVVNGLIAALPPQALAPPAGALDPGGALSLKVLDGASGIALSVPLQGTNAPSPPPVLPGADPAPPQPPENDNTRWFIVGRAFGPIAIDRLGMRYQNGQLGLLFDASMALGPVTIGFSGLGLSSPVNHFAPSPVLQGLSIDYASPAVTVGGGLLRTDNGYAGQVQLTTEAFGFALVGEYFTDPEGLFVFGLTREPPLGGPPAFFVEGVAVGMGYNSRLQLPISAADIANFSLVKAAMPNAPPPFDTGADLQGVLRSVNVDCSAQNGEGWLAAGVKFTSFTLVETFALLTLEFGRSTQIGILGLSRASLPPEAPDPVALFEVGLMAEFDPDRSALKVDGALSPRSYVLSRAAVLSGGFGFYSWFKDGDGVNAGDFVYSMGGYHPQFSRPAHYPDPARLSLLWQVNDNLSVKGSSYFALTPHCLMAGISMQANWASGDLSAWFDADADFLVYWKPFHYVAHIDTSIGVSYRLNLLFTSVTVSVHVGVGLDVKGPPFGGSAHIDLDVVSFTVSFGDDSDDSQFLKWSDFRTSFLPADTAVCSIQALNGLLRDRSKEMKSGEPQWIMTPDNAVLSVNLAAPAKTVAFADGAKPMTTLPDLPNTTWNAAVAIGPMGIAGDQFGSDLQIIVQRKGLEETAGAGVWTDYTVGRNPKIRSAPASLWREATEVRPQDPNAAALMLDTLCGFDISTPQRPPDTTQPVDLAALRYDDTALPLIWSGGVVTGYGLAPQHGSDLTYTLPGGASGACKGFVLQTINAASQTRGQIIAAMLGQGMLTSDFAAGGGVDLTAFSTSTVLDDWPAIHVLGEA